MIFRYFLLFGVSLFALFSVSFQFVAATENTELEEELERLEQDEQYNQAKELDEMLSFESFSSCEDMNTMLQDFLEENSEYFGGGMYGRGGGVFIDGDMAVSDMAEQSVVDESSVPPLKTGNMEGSPIASDGVDVSTTNVQVEGIDEPDILKTDGDYLYYYSALKQRIYIMQSPLDRVSSMIDLRNAEVISTIRIPDGFYNVDLLINDDRLVIIGQRRKDVARQSVIDNSSRVSVVIYDLSNVNNVQLERFIDLDGQYTDARLIGNQLYVISQLSVNRWYAHQLKEQGEEPSVQSFLPKGIDVAYNKQGQQPLNIKGTDYPYGVSVNRAGCDEIFYVLPSSESLESTSVTPSFTVVRSININDTNSDLETTTAFGTTQTVHMSHDSLYLVNPFWMQDTFSCPPNARCTMPWFGGGQSHTLLHKFAVDSGSLSYTDSTLIDGSPLSQYSMSEDDSGFFRIITQTWNPELNTHLFVLNPSLELTGMVRNIQKNEELKSSRFIGDKLYLVTFERTDPLFVVDIADPYNPAIIGELKIPGYSSYLHPYASASGGTQYLIGIGYDTAETERGGVNNLGVKIDLYKVDYNQKASDGSIAVTQEFSEVYGDQGSWSEALENPRMFVWNPGRKMLVLPLLLQNQENAQQCSVKYGSNGEEISRNCRDDYITTTEFAGMKTFSIDTVAGIQETGSYDYSDRFTQRDYYDMPIRPMMGEMPDGGGDEPVFAPEAEQATDPAIGSPEQPRNIGQWQFSEQKFRVGYAGDLLYTLGNNFAHFVVPNASQELFIDLE